MFIYKLGMSHFRGEWRVGGHRPGAWEILSKGMGRIFQIADGL